MSALEAPVDEFEQTERTAPTRNKAAVTYDRAEIYAVLDEALFINTAFTGPDGGPRILPIFHARIGDTLYMHGSTGSSRGLGAKEGLPVCASATLVDGLIYTKSWFHHSVNYRSVVVHGEAHVVSDPDERLNALRALVDRMAEGRSERSREPSKKELAMTAILALPLEEASIKQRSGGPKEEPEDEDLPFVNGVAEVTTTVAGRL